MSRGLGFEYLCHMMEAAGDARDIRSNLEEIGNVMMLAMSDGQVPHWTRAESERFFRSLVPEYVSRILSMSDLKPPSAAEALPSLLNGIAKWGVDGMLNGRWDWAPLVLSVYSFNCPFWNKFEPLRPSGSPFPDQLIQTLSDKVLEEDLQISCIDTLLWHFSCTEVSDTAFLEVLLALLANRLETAGIGDWFSYNHPALLRVFSNFLLLCEKMQHASDNVKAVVNVALEMVDSQVIDKIIMGMKIIVEYMSHDKARDAINPVVLLEKLMKTDLHDRVLQVIEQFVLALPESFCVSTDLLFSMEKRIEEADSSQKDWFQRIYFCLAPHLSVADARIVVDLSEKEQRNSRVNRECLAILASSMVDKDNDIVDRVCAKLEKECQQEDYVAIFKLLGPVFLSFPQWKTEFLVLSLRTGKSGHWEALDLLLSYYDENECCMLLESYCSEITSANIDLVGVFLSHCSTPLSDTLFRVVVELCTKSVDGWKVLIDLSKKTETYRLFRDPDWSVFLQVCDLEKHGVFFEMFEFLRGWTSTTIPPSYEKCRSRLIYSIAVYAFPLCDEAIFDKAFECWKQLFLSMDDIATNAVLGSIAMDMAETSFMQHAHNVIRFWTRCITSLEYLLVDSSGKSYFHRLGKIPCPVPGGMFSVTFRHGNRIADLMCHAGTTIREIQYILRVFPELRGAYIDILHDHGILNRESTLGMNGIVSACQLTLSVSPGVAGESMLFPSAATAYFQKNLVQALFGPVLAGAPSETEKQIMMAAWKLVKLIPFKFLENPVTLDMIRKCYPYECSFVAVLGCARRFLEELTSLPVQFVESIDFLVELVRDPECTGKKKLHILRLLMIPCVSACMRNNREFLSALLDVVVTVNTPKARQEAIGYLTTMWEANGDVESTFVDNLTLICRFMEVEDLSLLYNFISSFSAKSRSILFANCLNFVTMDRISRGLVTMIEAMLPCSCEQLELLIQKGTTLIMEAAYGSESLNNLLKLFLSICQNQGTFNPEMQFYQRLIQIANNDLTNQSLAYQICRVLGDRNPQAKQWMGEMIDHVANVTTTRWHFHPQELRAGGNGGLTNLGCTCYMNAILQQLFAIVQFRTFVFRYRGDNALCNALQEIFAKMALSTAPSIDVHPFAAAWGVEYPAFDPREQEDAESFMNNVLDKCPPEASEVLTWKVKIEFKGVKDEFSKVIDDTVRTFAINVKGVSSFAESMRQVQQMTLFTGANQYISEEYGRVDAQRFLKIVDVPEVLVLQLKRFDYDVERQRRIKLNDRLAVPFSFDIHTFFENCPSMKFDLSGIVMHAGTADHGHYVSIVKKNNKWVKYDDDLVEDVSQENMERIVASSNPQIEFSCPYLLIYTKAQANQGSSTVDEMDVPEEYRRRILKDNAISKELNSAFTRDTMMFVASLQQLDIMRKFYINVVCHSSEYDLANEFVAAMTKDKSKADEVGMFFASVLSSFIDILFDANKAIANSAVKLFKFACNSKNPDGPRSIVSSMANLIERAAGNWKSIEFFGKVFLAFTKAFPSEAASLNLLEKCTTILTILAQKRHIPSTYNAIVLWPLWSCVNMLKTEPIQVDQLLAEPLRNRLVKCEKTIDDVIDVLQSGAFDKIQKLITKNLPIFAGIWNQCVMDPPTSNDVLVRCPELMLICGIRVNIQAVGFLTGYTKSNNQNHTLSVLFAFLEKYMSILLVDEPSYRSVYQYLALDNQFLINQNMTGRVVSAVFLAGCQIHNSVIVKLCLSELFLIVFPEQQVALLEEHLHEYLSGVCGLYDGVIEEFFVCFREFFVSRAKLFISVCRSPVFIARFGGLSRPQFFVGILKEYSKNCSVLQAAFDLYSQCATPLLLLGPNVFTPFIDSAFSPDPSRSTVFFEEFIRNIAIFVAEERITSALEILREIVLAKGCACPSLTSDELKEALNVVAKASDLCAVCSFIVSLCQVHHDFCETAAAAVMAKSKETEGELKWMLWSFVLQICKEMPMSEYVGMIGMSIADLLLADSEMLRNSYVEELLSLLSTFITADLADSQIEWTTFIYMVVSSIPYGNTGMNEFLLQFFKTSPAEEVNEIIESFRSRKESGNDDPPGSLKRCGEILELACSALEQ